MDEFREWLSDNLRYFMLGGGILIVVLVLFLGIRACAGGKSSSNNSGDTQAVQTSEGSESSSTTETAVIENPLVEADEQIKALIESYYEALDNQDVETLKSIEVDFAAEDEDSITNNMNYIEKYVVGDVYTKNGLEDGSYVVYACYDYICTGIATPVPAMSVLYVVTDTDGSYKIQGTATDTTASSLYIQSLESDADVVALTAEVAAANEQALASDADLAAFLSGLGEDGTVAETDTSSENTMTVTADEVNVRPDASSDNDPLGTLTYGTTVTVKGEQDGWIIIDYNGQDGYVYSDFLSSDTGNGSSDEEDYSEDISEMDSEDTAA